MKKTYIIPTIHALLTQQVLDEGIDIHQSEGDRDTQLSDEMFFEEEEDILPPPTTDVWQ